MSLLKRIKRLEKQSKGDSVTITFTDGTHISPSKRDLWVMWGNISRIADNPLYKVMKAKHDEGITDTGGLIHCMIAYDPEEDRGLWDEAQ